MSSQEISLEMRPHTAGWLARHSTPTSFAIGFVSGLAAGLVFLGLIVPGYVVGRMGLPRRPAVIGLLAGFAVFTAWLFLGLAASGCPSCADGIVGLPIVVPFLLIPFQIGYWFGRRALRSPRRAVPVKATTGPRPRSLVAIGGFLAALLVDVAALVLFQVVVGVRPSEVLGRAPASSISQLIGASVIFGPPILVGVWLYRR